MSCKFLSLRLASARHVIQNDVQHQHRKQCISNQNQAQPKAATFMINTFEYQKQNVFVMTN